MVSPQLLQVYSYVGIKGDRQRRRCGILQPEPRLFHSASLPFRVSSIPLPGLIIALMSTAVAIPLALVAAYVVGSIDFAVIVARMHGVDIHKEGSGNPGTSNVLRTLGRLPAAMVYVGDTLKGTVGALMGLIASGISDPLSVPPYVTVQQVQWAFAAGFMAVIGHCYPVFHRFKGGKGVATAGGVILFTAPLVMLLEVLIWAVAVRLTRTASVGSMLLVVITLPLLAWRGVSGMGLFWVALIIALVVWRHRGNIQRIARGAEEKVPT